MDPKEIVGKRIQDFRKAKKITQEQLAEIVGIDTVSISKIETGRNYPTAENLEKIAAILDVKLYELFVENCIKSNEELLTEIHSGINLISSDNKKLHVLSASVKSLIV